MGFLSLTEDKKKVLGVLRKRKGVFDPLRNVLYLFYSGKEFGFPQNTRLEIYWTEVLIFSLYLSEWFNLGFSNKHDLE